LSDISTALAALEPAATKVRDPVTGRSMLLAGMITEPRVDAGTLKLTLTFQSGHSGDDRVRMQEALRNNLEAQGWTGPVVCNVQLAGRAPKPAPAAKAPPAKDPVRGMSGPGMQAHGGPVTKQPVEGVTHVVAVASGKGGVGKSTVAVNLACGLARLGHKVGLMDADVYGPSLPLMMNVNGQPMSGPNKKILPLMSYGVKCMSIGFLAPETEPIIWRGPMVMGLIRQFLHDVAWGPLDVLVIDLPPGTGDAQLTMIQGAPVSGAVIVTTPQDIALLDAVRGVEMFRKLEVPILGVVENMAWLDLPGGGRMHPFGEGGGVRMAERYGVDVLGQVPLDPRIREGGDHGAPAVLADDGPTVEVMLGVARAVVAGLG